MVGRLVHPGEGERVGGEASLREPVSFVHLGGTAKLEGKVIPELLGRFLRHVDALLLGHGDGDAGVGAAPEDRLVAAGPVGEPAVAGLHREEAFDALADDRGDFLLGLAKLGQDLAELLRAQPRDRRRGRLLDAAVGILEEVIESVGRLDEARVREGELHAAGAVEKAGIGLGEGVGEIGSVAQGEGVGLAEERQRVTDDEFRLGRVAQLLIGERADFPGPLRFAGGGHGDGEGNGLGRAGGEVKFHDLATGSGIGSEARGDGLANAAEEDRVRIERHGHFDFLGGPAVVMEHGGDIDLVGEVGEAGQGGLDDERLVDHHGRLAAAEAVAFGDDGHDAEGCEIVRGDRFGADDPVGIGHQRGLPKGEGLEVFADAVGIEPEAAATADDVTLVAEALLERILGEKGAEALSGPDREREGGVEGLAGLWRLVACQGENALVDGVEGDLGTGDGFALVIRHRSGELDLFAGLVVFGFTGGDLGGEIDRRILDIDLAVTEAVVGGLVHVRAFARAADDEE